MASRYWVGGSASWDGTAGTKWATTSGGAGGAAVPTSADDVFFDANSGAVTVTKTGTEFCAACNFTGFTGTFAGAGTLNLYGSLTAVAGMTWTFSGGINFSGSGALTLTSAGKTLGAIVISRGTGSDSVTLQDALISSGSITLTVGTFTTNNYNVTATSISSTNSNTRTINLGSSTVTLSANGTVINFGTNTNLTFNAGTSTIIGTNSLVAFTGSALSGFGVTFYNVATTNTAASVVNFNGINTFNNVTLAAPVSAGVTQVTFDARQTINGTLSTTGTAGNRRVWFRGVTYGLAQTLTINSAPSLTDADFRDIYVVGTAAPISGTRVGNLAGCRGITFSTPKTVYWVTAGGGNWSGNNWAASSGGAASTDNFPLAQDTAKIENTGLNTSATVTMDSAVPYTGTVDMSGRTSAMTLSLGASQTIYGDWKNGSGTTITTTAVLIFSGRNTQTITSAGKTSTAQINVDSYGGSVELADALNIGSNNLNVVNGTLDTKNYNVTAGGLSSSNSNVRTINLGSSTLTLSGSSPISFTTSTNLTLNAGTSQINCTATNGPTITTGSGLTFYAVSLIGASSGTASIIGTSGTFNSLTITAGASAGIYAAYFSTNYTITGTLTVAGASAVRRIFVQSDTLGTTRTLTVNTLSATDCDFRDITIAGTAAGSSPTRAGDCGGNTGITFPAPKTVYAVGAGGAESFSTLGWATSSGGATNINNFPLAQDVLIVDNSSNATSVFFNPLFNFCTFNASSRTSALTLSASAGTANFYGNFLLGSGITSSSTGNALNFTGRGTQTITSNGITIGSPITVNCFTGTVQLADALTLGSTRTLSLISGTFDAVSYNVTAGLVSCVGTVKMGSGTWTLSGVGGVWDYTGGTLYKGTANILLSDTSTSARTFSTSGIGASYNKLTIGGTTGTSTLTINANCQFTEIASTKTVAHTIALGATTQTFGKWSVTGTVGNVVTVTGTATLTIAGAAVSGVDYLAMGTTAMSTTSPGEFYAGANSTGTGAGITLTAAPAPRTLYWVGGTGNWNDTAHWSTSSGGASGAAIPTSLDAVNFDSASNATAYTVTVNAASLRCGSLTMAGPASGNVTWAGSNPLYIHGSVSLAATGITRTYTGAITLSSSSTGLTFTTNGNTLASDIVLQGIGCAWTLGSALTTGSSNNIQLQAGTFNTGNYNVSAARFQIMAGPSITLTLGSSTITENSIGFTAASNVINFTLNSGTSTINNTATSPTFSGNNQTFYNVNFTSTSAGTVTINGANTFNNLSFTGITAAGLKVISVTANQTINGTLTFSAGTNATMRHFARSDTIGTTRTLTCAAFSGTDVDFRDITIAGAAAPVSGTRLGDAKGNSGITFGAGASKYWNLAGGGNWSDTGWATTGGGSVAANNFPLAQDTAVFQSTGLNSGSTITVNAAYNIGTIDMSARTSNTMTLATGTTAPFIYGNWINGTGTTISGTGVMTFAGRGSQTITSAGVAFTQPFTVNTPGGSVTLQDAFTGTTTGVFTIAAGTFNAATFNVTLTGAQITTSATTTKTIAFGSGTWTLGGTVPWGGPDPASTTITGTGTISLTSASAKSFGGNGLSYSGITIDQGGAGTLTISGNNTFKNITNSYSATGATTINIGTTTQRVTQFTATGTSGKVLTVQGTSASSPGTLILTSGTVSAPDYLTITGVRAYSLDTTWYAGANSTNNGSLGWYFSAYTPVVTSTGNFLLMFG